MRHPACQIHSLLLQKSPAPSSIPACTQMDGSNSPELNLPGFRFHPTEEELLEFYLKGALHGEKLTFDIIGTTNIYHHHPRELPGLAKIGEREWYFLVPRDMRHSHGRRPNRTTQNGFWKATGSDRSIRSAKDPKRIIGLRKTLVFYNGRAPRGSKTDWIMNEYRMPDACSHPKEDMVLCKVYRKATPLKTLEQRAAMELEDTRMLKVNVHPLVDPASSPDQDLDVHSPVDEFWMESKPDKKADKKDGNHQFVLHNQQQEAPKQERVKRDWEIPPVLELPNHSLEWMLDPLLLRSPWLGTFSPCADLLNF